MIINPYIFGSTYDPDAQAFFTASGLTGTTNLNAINQLVLDLKSYGLWTKMKAIYPFIGGTAALHKWNLKDPRDLDAAFRLVFNGGVTHNINGATFNGTNGYADTYLNPLGALTANSNHLSLYSRTSAQRVSGANDMGMGDNIAGNNCIVICIRRPGDVCYYLNNAILISTTNTNGQGLYIGTTRANNDRKYFKNNTSLGTNTTLYNQVLTNFNFYIGAYNAGGVAATYADFQTAFATIGDGLNDSEAGLLYTIIQAFQTTLGRSIGTQTVSDSDAQAFINAAVIEDQVQANAINTLVIDLKANNLWTKMKAIYPFVGGTASSHKWNLKNPLDTDAAFRLIFNGGWTHDLNGATPNGTNAYADTKFNPTTHLTNASAHFAKYNRTLDITGNKVEGALDTGNSSFFQQNYSLANGLIGEVGAVASYTATDSRGLFTVSRTATNAQNVLRNSTQVATSSVTITNIPNKSLYIGARNDASPAGYNLYQTAFASYGDGLSNSEIATLYTIVQTFQTTLNRQV